ncbi:MAG: hypothetical protein OSB38_35280 [Paraburkholderia fungorum]|nr:hypothetical protein [Paraburkholderia fungorum]
MIRALDRFYEKHPTLSFLIAICCVFAIMEIAHQWDQDDTAALRLQMWVATARDAT